MNANNVPATVAMVLSIGTLVFNAGRESNRINDLFSKAHAAESERKDTRELIFDIHGKVSGIEKDIQYIREKTR
jgi:hypothetical protein